MKEWGRPGYVSKSEYKTLHNLKAISNFSTRNRLQLVALNGDERKTSVYFLVETSPFRYTSIPTIITIIKITKKINLLLLVLNLVMVVSNVNSSRMSFYVAICNRQSLTNLHTMGRANGSLCPKWRLAKGDIAAHKSNAWIGYS